MENFCKIKTYKSGLRLIVQNMPGFKSVSIGVNINVGSCDEENGKEGIAHFTEHMLFKGTKNRTTEELMQMLEGLGIVVNAATGASDTIYFCDSIKEHLETCFDVLSDMYFNSVISEKSLNSERGAVLQEMALYKDNPLAVASDKIIESFYKGTCFQHPIIGSNKSVNGISSNDILGFIKNNYIAPNTIITLSGNVTMEEAEKLTEKYFENNFKSENAPNVPEVTVKKFMPVSDYVFEYRKNEQNNVIIAFPTENLFTENEYAIKLFSYMLGGGMTSRLFYEVREKQGLVYHISSEWEPTKIGGMFSMLFNCTPENTKKVVATIKTEIDKLLVDGITDSELIKAKNAYKSNIIFSEEKVNSRMSANAVSLSNKNKVSNPKMEIENILKVTKQQVNGIIKEIFSTNNIVACLVGLKNDINPLEILIDKNRA